MDLFTYFALKNKAVVCILAELLESQEIFNFMLKFFAFYQK